MKNEMKPQPKKSENVFNRAIAVAEQRADEANRRYHSWNKTSLTLGVTLALALPAMALMSSLSDPSAPVTITGPVEVTGQVTATGQVTSTGKVTAQGEVQSTGVVNAEGVVDSSGIVRVSGGLTVDGDVEMSGAVTATGAIGVTGDLAGSGGTKVEIAGPIYDVTWAAEVPRKWYRTTFSRAGDEFWALPDASFTIELTQNITLCDADSCDAEFSLRSAKYLAGVSGTITVPRPVDCEQGRRCLNLDNLGPNAPTPSGCRVNKNAVIPEYVCRFFDAGNHLNDDPNSRDLCVSFRRSEIFEDRDEFAPTPHVALEIKWERVEFHGNPPDTCPGWNSAEPLPLP